MLSFANFWLVVRSEALSFCADIVDEVPEAADDEGFRLGADVAFQSPQLQLDQADSEESCNRNQRLKKQTSWSRLTDEEIQQRRRVGNVRREPDGAPSDSRENDL